MIRTCDVSGSQSTKEHTWERGKVEHLLPVVDSFHLYDRSGRAVSHDERLQVDRIPAIVELCIQAGVDIPEHPTRRREYPIYRVAGRLIDFEKRFPKDYSSGKDISAFGFWDTPLKSGGVEKNLDLLSDDIKGLSFIVFSLPGCFLWCLCTEKNPYAIYDIEISTLSIPDSLVGKVVMNRLISLS